jgi:hypothetical protein
VSSGANGECDPGYLCTAGDGYSGPAGEGSPDFTGLAVTTDSCVNGWEPSAQPDPTASEITTETVPESSDSAVAALSAGNVWTAGYEFTVAPSETGLHKASFGLIQHWNGKSWTRYSTPFFTNGEGEGTAALDSLSFDKADDGWAVGYLSTVGIINEASNTAPLAEHWNGTSWTASPVLEPVKTFTGDGRTTEDYAELIAVKAISPDDVWAAGWYNNLNTAAGTTSNAFDGSFMEHWNGSSWQVVSIPDQAAGQVEAITAFGTDDVWVTENTADGPVAAHYNGHTWTLTDFAATGNSGIGIGSLSGTSPDSIWAAGSEDLAESADGVPNEIPYLEHWNGTSWSAVPITGVDSVDGPSSLLTSVVAVSATDAWAVGTWNGEVNGLTDGKQYLLLHWNGKDWTISDPPRDGDPDGLLSIAATGSGDVWLTGDQYEYQAGGGADFSPIVLRNCG